MKKTTLGRQLHHQQLMPTTAGNLRQSFVPPYPSTFTKFNSALGAGLLNPTSPPLGPTLYQMISSDHDHDPPNDVVSLSPETTTLMGNEKQGMMKQRISEILAGRDSMTRPDDLDKGNVRVVLSDRDGFRTELSVQRGVLVRNSRYFARELGTKQGMMDGWVGDGDGDGEGQFTVEIVDCEDVEVYAETLRLMHCGDLRRRLMKEGVPKVLAILKVSAAIGFDAGVLSCLEYLEAAPWSEDEEEKVSSLLSQLHLEDTGGATEVLQRICLDGTVQQNNIYDNKEEALLKLLHVVLEGTDEKARRDMKGLVSKMLRESANHSSDLTNESLYAACDRCLHKLHLHFLLAAKSDLQDVGQISRQVDNLLWILDTLFNRQIAGEFLKTWASQSEMSRAHPKVPPLHRFEISRVTARLFVGIGKGQVLASKDVRSLLLQTWLVPFYDDFGWMRRASKGLDRHSVEDGLSNTILTLPLGAQRDVFLAWFDRFLNSGDDCPDIRRGFEVWWRRAFWKRKGDQVAKPHVRIVDGSSIQ